ncbi:hypothetical protein [Poritiphilus flavus]|uniref:DUF4412 domain-containing protein n=1 Tax=Poritiphilus flavus TaxID=2697053 RepID=A0A6L9EFG9_9FLAO|nr:hypothetical protein [Poritiphilus flavus]NAS13332.1 hypothetical protein [Poritiphilus flavus]
MLRTVLFIALSLSVFLNSYSQDYFEGEVHFKINYEPLMDQISEELLIQEFGDTLIGYVQERRYIMETNTKGEMGRTRLIMMMDENYAYLDGDKSDTIYKYRLDKESAKLLRIEKKESETATVLGDVCPSVELDYETTDPNSYFKQSIGRYYYNPKYRLNKEAYANHESGFWNLYVNEAGAISVLNMVVTWPIYRSIMKAFKIHETKVPDKMFDLNQTQKIIKEIE